MHVDGLYRALDSGVRCEVRAKTAPRVHQAVTIGLHYDPTASTIDVSATSPVNQVLAKLPGACPQQGDSLDLLLDNYFTPGFSFAPGYGIERWFTSTTVAIPVAVFHRASTITVRLADTKAGTPPRDCAVVHRSFEHCTTRGAWAGVVTLKAVGDLRGAGSGR